ncbi:MAG: phage terminase large subunit [Patescibacteria group bacterium]|nr:phage terminase large subunit [Patescibacteria group bacterium]
MPRVKRERSVGEAKDPLLAYAEAHPELGRELTPRLTPYIPHTPTPKQQAFLLLNCLDAFYGGSAGGGKGLNLCSGVLTPFGFRATGDLKVGDAVTNPDGTVARILQLHPISMFDAYKVSFHDGTEVICNDEHRWLAWKARRSRKMNNKRVMGEASAQIVDIPVLIDWLRRGEKPLIPINHEVPFNRTSRWEHERNPLIPPYLLGALLGNGCITGNASPTLTFHSEDEKVLQRAISLSADECGVYKTPNKLVRTCRFLGGAQNHLTSSLRTYGLLGTTSFTKFIPDCYKYASIKDRYALVKGLMDTDGYVDNRGQVYYTTVSLTLAQDMAFVLRSLGSVVTITGPHPSHYLDENGERVACQDSYDLYIKHRKCEKLFYSPRKKKRAKSRRDCIMYKRIESIEKLPQQEEMRCITVSHPNGLFITNDFTVTHNSDALLMAALQYVDIPGYSALLIRNTFQNLTKADSLISRSKDWLINTNAHWNGDNREWTFPCPGGGTSTLAFGYLDGPDDHFNYQSAAYQFIGIDECVQIRANQAEYMFSRLRRKLEAPIPVRYRCASNPPAAEQIARGAWVKKKYVDAATREDGVVFISAKLVDNPYLDQKEYTRSLMKLDAVTRAQLLDGDWEIQAQGNMFRPSWFQIINRREVPATGAIVRGWDFAASEDARAAWTAGVRMRRCFEGNYYIEHIKRFRGTPFMMESTLRAMAEADGPSVMIDIPQDPGQAGKYQVRQLIKKLAGYNARCSLESGSKIERAMALSAQVEMGCVFLVEGPWNDDFLAEARLFPNGEFLDQIDACSRAFHALLNHVHDNKVSAPIGIAGGRDFGKHPSVQKYSKENTCVGFGIRLESGGVQRGMTDI